MEMCLSEQNSASGSDRSSMHGVLACTVACTTDVTCQGFPGHFLEAKNEVWYVDESSHHQRARANRVRTYATESERATTKINCNNAQVS